MMVLMLIFCTEKNVAFGQARLTFIIPETKDSSQFEEIVEDPLYIEGTVENKDTKNTIRIYTIEGFIELKIEEIDKEEIWKFIKDIEWKKQLSQLLEK